MVGSSFMHKKKLLGPDGYFITVPCPVPAPSDPYKLGIQLSGINVQYMCIPLQAHTHTHTLLHTGPSARGGKAN